MTRREDLMETVLRLRDAGRSWSEVKRVTGLAVADAKELVRTATQARRTSLAVRHVNEVARGRLDPCCGTDAEVLVACRHQRGDHDDSGCTRCSCEEFLEQKPGPTVLGRRYSGDARQQLLRLTGTLVTHNPQTGQPLKYSFYAWPGETFRLPSGRTQEDDPRIPSARVVTRLRRARRKQSQADAG